MPFRIPLFNPSPVKNCFANFGVDTFTIMFALSEKQKYGDTYNIKNINMWIPKYKYFNKRFFKSPRRTE